MCGKYSSIADCCKFNLGSPPHVREILQEEKEIKAMIRITPACAGNTLKDPSMTLPAI